MNEAATGITETLALYTDYGRSSYDGKGATVVASRALREGLRQRLLGRHPAGLRRRRRHRLRPVHQADRRDRPRAVPRVTEHTANLTYQGQSGALNESMSDVFGACVKQRHLGQDAASADWLVGEGIFVAGIKGKALRSMVAPGTAYDDPQLGKDPQVGDMADYVDTTDDNGGVHTNSGIPNRAFVLAAKAVGGESWSGAGRIWYAALTSGLAADTDFATFAAATVAAAGDHADAVTAGLDDRRRHPRAARPATSGAPHRRAGGRGGPLAAGSPACAEQGALDLDSDDPRAPQARELIDRIDSPHRRRLPPRPARRLHLQLPPPRRRGTVPEHALTDDQRHLARLLLDD